MEIKTKRIFIFSDLYDQSINLLAGVWITVSRGDLCRLRMVDMTSMPAIVHWAAQNECEKVSGAPVNTCGRSTFHSR